MNMPTKTVIEDALVRLIRAERMLQVLHEENDAIRIRLARLEDMRDTAPWHKRDDA
jgi:hypothetical protein